MSASDYELGRSDERLAVAHWLRSIGREEDARRVEAREHERSLVDGLLAREVTVEECTHCMGMRCDRPHDGACYCGCEQCAKPCPCDVCTLQPFLPPEVVE